MGVSQLGSDAEYDLQVDMGLEVGRHPGGQDSEWAWSGGEEVGGGRGSWVPCGGLSLKPSIGGLASHGHGAGVSRAARWWPGTPTPPGPASST